MTGFVGPKQMMEDIHNILKASAGVKGRGTPHPKTNSPTCFQIAYASKDSVRVGEFLYKDATIYLPRKWEKVKELL